MRLSQDKLKYNVSFESRILIRVTDIIQDKLNMAPFDQFGKGRE